MPVSDTVKLNTPWEYVYDRVNTSDAKEVYEEAASLDRRIFGESIPLDAASIAIYSSLAFGAAHGVIRRIRAAFTLDNSAANKQAWFLLRDPITGTLTWKTSWSSGGMQAGEIETRLLSDAVHPVFKPKLFGGTNGSSEIYPLDASSPVITPRGGLARFANGRSAELGTTQANSIWGEFFIYEGMMLDEVLASLKTNAIDIGEPVNIYIAARDAV